MSQTTPPPVIGVSMTNRTGQWVQTERKTHEIWARYCLTKPTAASLLHYLVAQMGNQNAVIISQKVLAKIMGRSVETIKRAIRDLASDRWIQVVRIGKGKEAAYVINDRVAWGQPRDQLRLSIFSAAVVADVEDQDNATLEVGDLRRIPTLYPGERQLPAGPGAEPPSQPSFDGLEADLPAIVRDDSGMEWEVDQTTGELQGRLLE